MLAMLRQLWPLSLGAFALGMDAYVPAGLLPGMASDLHTSEARAGLSVASFTAAYAIAAPLLAPAAVRYPTRLALLAGLSLFCLGNLASILVPDLRMMLLARWMAGIGAGLYSPLASSCAANMVAPAQRGRALALVLAGLGMGTALGVPAGQWLEGYYGWRWAIVLIMGLGLVAAGGVGWRGRDFPVAPRIPWRLGLAVLQQRFNLGTLAVTLFTGIAALGLYTYIATIASGRALGRWTAMLINLWGLGGLCGTLLIGLLLGRILTPARAMPLLLLVLAAGVGLFAYAPLPLALFGCFMSGLSDWASIPPQQQALMDHAPEQAVALVAWNSSLNYLGGAIGIAAGSWLLSRTGRTDWLPLAAGMALVIAMVLHGWKLGGPGAVRNAGELKR